MRIISRTVLILSIVSLFNDIASEILYPVIPLYLDSIGFSVLWIGILEGVANFTAGISKGYFGKMSDEKGVRLPFVKLGYLFSAISKPMMAVFVYPLWIFFARTLDKLGKGVRTSARDALLSQEATKETKARVFGFHRSLDTAGATIGPALALLFLFYRPGEYKAIFYFSLIPGIISVLLIFLLKEKRRTVSTLSKGNFFSFFKYWKIAAPSYKRLIAGLLLFALFNSSDIFLLLRTKELLGDKTVELLGIQFSGDTITIAAYVFYNLIYALASYPLGAAADKWGLKRVFVLGLLLFAIVYGGFAANPSIPVIFFLFLLYGIYSAATEGITKAWITNIANDTNTATAIGFYTSCESICAFFASIIAGALWTGCGSFFVFLLPAAIAISVMTYFSLKIKHTD